MTDPIQKSNRAVEFRVGFLAGLTIVGGLALILLAIFFL